MNISDTLLDKVLDILVGTLSEDGPTWEKSLLSILIFAFAFIAYRLLSYTEKNFSNLIRKARGLDRIDKLNAEIRQIRVEVFSDIDACLKKIKKRKNYFDKNVDFVGNKVNSLCKEDPNFNASKRQVLQSLNGLKGLYQGNIQDLEDSLNKIKKELRAAERLLAEKDRKSQELTSKYYEDPDESI